MIHLSKYTTEYRALTKLGLPITVSQIGMRLQGLCDTIMLGQHSAMDLAAAGFLDPTFLINLQGVKADTTPADKTTLIVKK